MGAVGTGGSCHTRVESPTVRLRGTCEVLGDGVTESSGVGDRRTGVVYESNVRKVKSLGLWGGPLNGPGLRGRCTGFQTVWVATRPYIPLSSFPSLCLPTGSGPSGRYETVLVTTRLRPSDVGRGVWVHLRLRGPPSVETRPTPPPLVTTSGTPTHSRGPDVSNRPGTQ